MRLTVRTTPRAGRDAIIGWQVDPAGRPFLQVKVAAAPTDGQANAAVVALIARALGRPKSAVRIVAGETARLKRLEVDGAGPDDLAAAFGPPPQGL